MDIGSRIKKLRTERGLTQEQLAKTLYVSRQTILNWEQGRTTPDAQSLLLLSALFGITVDTLMKGEVHAMAAMLNAHTKLPAGALACVVATGLVGSSVLALPLTNELGALGGALCLTPALTALIGMAVATKSLRPTASIEALRAGLERSTSLMLSCYGQRSGLSAKVTDTNGRFAYRIDSSGSVPRGKNWDVVDEYGDRIATVRYRSIAVGNPCPYIKAQIDGLGSIKMEKTVSMSTEFKSVWKLSGADIGIEGDWLDSDVTFTRGAEPMARMHALESTHESAHTYQIEVSNGLLCGTAIALAFALALMRDLERPLV